ncbi:hypothetical protein NZK27_00770 [Synechococcus sp. FGCU-3]|nr:hypothetical protein [Synechococcus sp. FGCU3]
MADAQAHRKCLLWLGCALVAGWLAWPLLRPRLWPASSSPWLVVLDGYHRLDGALRRQAGNGEPILLITCPATAQPTPAQLAQQSKAARLLPQRPPMLVVLDGFDTATQAVALAQWLQRRQRRGNSLPRQLLLVSDLHHFPRAQFATQIAVGGMGPEVLAFPVPASTASAPAPGSWSDWPVWRDALRLQLWRLTGSTGAFLSGAELRRKIEHCW